MDIFEAITLRVLAFGGVIAIIDYVGLMPPKVAKWFARNRLEVMLQALTRLGVRVRWDEQASTISILEKAFIATGIKEPAYKVRLNEMLADDTFSGTVWVGANHSFSSDGFIDVMGGSTSYSKSAEYAKILNTHARMQSISTFDVVATPKTGSPILGYEFSRLVGKPLVLGVLEKVNDDKGHLGLHSQMDYPITLSLKDKKVLIVDDSTTGGRKMTKLVEMLREAGATVSEALVLFEPKGKGARESLEKIHVTLHSIVDGPVGRF